MKLDAEAAFDRLRTCHHGVLATTNSEGAVDLVPVVYVVGADGQLGIPIDRVKAKRPGELQRERNLAHDPRATLLVEGWDEADWSRLWWVRGRLRWLPDPDAAVIAALGNGLEQAYEQYRDQPFDRILVFDVVKVSGWAA